MHSLAFMHALHKVLWFTFHCRECPTKKFAVNGKEQVKMHATVQAFEVVSRVEENEAVD